MAAERVLALAAWCGANALPLFFALLTGLLAGVVAGWWLLRAQLLPRLQRRVPEPAFVLLNGAAGFGIVAAAAAGFAEIAEQLAPSGTMALFDEALTASVRRHVAATTLQSFKLLTHGGDALTLALLGVAVTLLLWATRRRALALGWALALGGNGLLNPLLKRVFERARPLHDHGLVGELGFSFPSGHSSGATVAYGMLAYVAVRTLPPAWHLPAVLAASALAFSVGASRIFLQVHFASDVLAGFATGTAWLAACIVSVELSRRWRQGNNADNQGLAQEQP